MFATDEKAVLLAALAARGAGMALLVTRVRDLANLYAAA